jgi:hypothetical protein
MNPRVWLFRLDSAIIRVVQREFEGKAEIVVLGSDGLRKHQVFETAADADRFRATLELELRAGGFQLSWTNTTPPA